MNSGTDEPVYDLQHVDMCLVIWTRQTLTSWLFAVWSVFAANFAERILFQQTAKKNEPVHDKTYNKTCVTSKD